MLSFDITDRNIRVVKGVESNGKIKISSAATLNLEEGLIVNGHVKDTPNVATLVNGILKRNRMPDKEAIVSLSSNLTIFKELTVPRVKPQDMQKQVKQQVQSELNLDDTFSVTYVIVGDDGADGVKVLATACPYEIVNSYKEVFKLLGISLRSVMVGCNCITKVLLADTRIRAKMPLLAVQIDSNFISLNLYERGQLSFSRFASIDPDDYGGSADYVFEAVNENIFRMLQFHRSRNTGEIIENVVFYGDTHEYVRLTDELEKLDLNTNLINVPPQIHGHENLEFSLYANAIGAMFKRNRDTEKINLLETELGTAIKRAAANTNENAGMGIMLGCILGAAVITGAAYGVTALINMGVENDIEETVEFIESKDTRDKLALRDRLIILKENVSAYNTVVVNAHDGYYSQPVVNGDQYDALQNVLDKTAEDLGLKVDECFVGTPSYSNGMFTFTVKAAAADDDKYIQELPAQFLDNLLNSSFSESKGYFHSATYQGYSVKTEKAKDDAEEKKTVTFNVTVNLNERESAYKPAKPAEEKASEE